MKHIFLNDAINNWFVSFREKFYNWFTSKGASYRPTSEYLYKTTHLIYLGIVVVSLLLVFFLFKNKSTKTKYMVLRFFAYILIACEVLTRLSRLLNYKDLGILDLKATIKILVPMQFCSVIIWVIMYGIFTEKKNILGFSSVCGLIGTIVYMFYPIEGLGHTFFTIKMLFSPLTHGIGLITCVCILGWGLGKLKFKDIWKTYLFLACMAVYGFILNQFYTTENFMYIMFNPTNINFDPIPYQIVLAVVVALIVFIVYAIAFIIEKITTKHNYKKLQN